jgi:hypothetical protein
MNIDYHFLSADKIFDGIMPVKRSLRDSLFPRFNAWQRWSFIALLFFFNTTILLAIGYWINSDKEYAQAALVSLMLMYFAFFIFQFALISPGIRKLIEPERALMEPTIQQFTDDLKRAEWLARSFRETDIQFAQQRLTLLGDHLRHRISLMTGSIEKVGLIPLGVAAFLTLQKLQADKLTLDFAALEWGGIALAVFYFAAAMLHQTAHSFQRHELVFKMALDLKRNQESKSIK